jgi:hypothetical protein
MKTIIEDIIDDSESLIIEILREESEQKKESNLNLASANFKNLKEDSEHS